MWIEARGGGGGVCFFLVCKSRNWAKHPDNRFPVELDEIAIVQKSVQSAWCLDVDKKRGAFFYHVKLAKDLPWPIYITTLTHLKLKNQTNLCQIVHIKLTDIKCIKASINCHSKWGWIACSRRKTYVYKHTHTGSYSSGLELHRNDWSVCDT